MKFQLILDLALVTRFLLSEIAIALSTERSSPRVLMVSVDERWQNEHMIVPAVYPGSGASWNVIGGIRQPTVELGPIKTEDSLRESSRLAVVNCVEQRTYETREASTGRGEDARGATRAMMIRTVENPENQINIPS